MSGPHPAVAAVRGAVRPFLARAPHGVLVACSGGADSLALAAAVAFEAPRAEVPAGLVTVDHGLQPDSAQVAARVAAHGAELGLDPVSSVRVTVGTAGGPEAAARTARYAALAGIATELDRAVLLGHTRDDQAETVLLGLGRGSGPRSIAGMRPWTGRFGRPLLDLPRATTVAACAALGLLPWQDPHNADRALQRVRLREEVLPLLEDVLQGGVGAALARTAGLLRDDLEALDELAAATLAALRRGAPDRAAGQLAAEELATLPRAIRTRVLRGWARAAGATDLTAGHVAALDGLVVGWHGQGGPDLPGGVSVSRVSGRLQAQRRHG